MDNTGILERVQLCNLARISQVARVRVKTLDACSVEVRDDKIILVQHNGTKIVKAIEMARDITRVRA